MAPAASRRHRDLIVDGGSGGSVDLTTGVLVLAFVLLFAVSLWRFAKRPGPLELSVLAVFSAWVSLLLLQLLDSLAPSLAPVFRPLLISALWLQPYLVLRLVDQIQPVSIRISRFVLLGSVASTAALLAAPREPRTFVPAIAFFFVAQTIAGIRFAVASRRRFGLARIRLALVAVGTVFFGGAVLILGIGAAFANGGPTPVPFTQAAVLTSVFAALGYVAAFLSPGSARRFAYRAVAFDLVRSLVAPPVGTDSGRLWEQLAATAREILGARTVAIEAEPNGTRLATVGGPLREDVGDGTGEAAGADGSGSSGERIGPVSTIVVRVRSAGGPSEQLVAEIEGRPLFVEDDVALLQLLGSLTARAVDREGALIGLGEAKRAIEESAVIRASEARFRALLEADPNAVLALDETGKVTWATRQAGDMFGSTAEALVGTNLGDLVVLHSDGAVGRGADRSVFRAETTGRRVNGTRFPAEIARADFELDGRPFQLAVISDVTWRHEADQIRERFLGVLSHELRTPVTSIYGGTQLLLGRGARLDPETRAELLVGVAAESERLQRMIENLVAMARIERGAEYGGPRPVLVERTLKSLVEREKALWPEVTIRLVSSGPVAMVAADEEYLAQVMRNLLSNAAKYGGPGSTVEVHLVDGVDEVQVLVRDDGPGINEEDADKLFNLYYRAAPAAATAPGAGIGLFVCHELVAMMGGRTWVKNRPEGGAEFGFTLPVYPDELEPGYDDPPLAAPKPAPIITTATNGTSGDGNPARDPAPGSPPKVPA
jgi:PAS domain S-box-containing protein